MKFKIKQLFKMLSQHIIFPFIYFINRWRKTDERLVIFADAHHDFCPPHMRELHELLEKENYSLYDCFFDVAKLTSFDGIKRMIGFMRLYPRAAYVVVCDNFLPVSSCNKKKKTKVIQLWHGCGAFKKFGFDAAEDIPLFYHGNVYKNYDIVTVSGDECIKYFSSAMHAGDGIVQAIGVSHTDRLYDSAYIETCKSKLRYLYPDAYGKKVVLWAPTFRGNAACTFVCGENYIDKLSMDADLSEAYIIKSLHPHLMHQESGNDIRMTTDELIACADVLITDYSSVFFEYLLVDKPIIFFAPDYKEYERGFYLDYDELPGYVVKGENLKSTLVSVLKRDTMINVRKAYREKYMNACDGNATERIISSVFTV